MYSPIRKISRTKYQQDDREKKRRDLDDIERWVVVGEGQ
jgi:hypothetical protein